MRAIEESNAAIKKVYDAMEEMEEYDKTYYQMQIANAKAIQALAFSILELARQTNRMKGRVN